MLFVFVLFARYLVKHQVSDIRKETEPVDRQPGDLGPNYGR